MRSLMMLLAAATLAVAGRKRDARTGDERLHEHGAAMTGVPAAAASTDTSAAKKVHTQVDEHGAAMTSMPASAASTDTSAAKKVYTCSMHPNVRSDRPGNCPICGMKLVLYQPKASADSSR